MATSTKIETILADPLSVATHGLISDVPLTIAVRGWILENILEIEFPLLDGWYFRRDDTDVWHGPLSYRDANSQARRITKPKSAADSFPVKYAQVGQVVGSRGGDPRITPHMRVVYMYANGRQYIGGKLAEHNKDKLPI